MGCTKLDTPVSGCPPVSQTKAVKTYQNYPFGCTGLELLYRWNGASSGDMIVVVVELLTPPLKLTQHPQTEWGEGQGC